MHPRPFQHDEDPTRILARQHIELRALANRLLMQPQETLERDALWETTRRALARHADLEELVYFPAMLVAAHCDFALQALEGDHRDQMNAFDRVDKRDRQALSDWVRTLALHFDTEEQEIFPWLDARTDVDRIRMGRLMRLYLDAAWLPATSEWRKTDWAQEAALFEIV